MRSNTRDVGASFSVVTKTAAQDIGIGTKANTFPPVPEPYTNMELDTQGCAKKINTNCPLDIKFTTVNDIPTKVNNGQISMTLPANLQTSATSCTATIGGNLVECSKAGSQITIQHSSASSVAGQQVVVSLTQITNPSSN